MPADLKAVRLAYVKGMQAACKKVAELKTVLTNLDKLYTGSGLSGTFVDAELADKEWTKHMVAADVGTFTANLDTVRTAITTPISENMAKAVGDVIG